VEKNVESTIKEVAPKGEETVIPGAIYVGIAGMGGSILARNRIFPFPRLLLFVCGLDYFSLPPDCSHFSRLWLS
jgi:Apolipoprotein O